MARKEKEKPNPVCSIVRCTSQTANVTSEPGLAICLTLSSPWRSLLPSEKILPKMLASPKPKCIIGIFKKIKTTVWKIIWSKVSKQQPGRYTLPKASFCVVYELRMFWRGVFFFFKHLSKVMKIKKTKIWQTVFGLQYLKYLLLGPFQKKLANPVLIWLSDTIIFCALLLGKWSTNVFEHFH